MSATPNLIYVAYGRADIRLEALYAAYSAIAWSDAQQLRIRIYTDDAEAFAAVSRYVSRHDISEQRLRELRGPGDYAFRVKIALLAETALETQAPVAFADADTFFTAPVAQLFARVNDEQSVLHRREYHVLRHTTSQVRRFRRRMAALAGADLALDSEMWNSGVIGVAPAHFAALDDILRVIDKVAPRYKKALVEQYAVSYFLAHRGRVASCDDLVFHYWYQKPDYEREIAARLERWNTLPMEVALAELRAHPIALAPPPRKVKWWEDAWSRVRFGHPLEDTRGLPRR